MSAPERRRRAVALLLTGALLTTVGTLAGCTSPASEESSPTPATGSTSVLTPVPLPPPGPPSGRLVADLRQSSRDAALGRMQVWVDNDTRHGVRPSRIDYLDPRLRRPVPGERLREIPARVERGFPLDLPPDPRCEAPRRTSPQVRPRLRVTYADRTVTVPVRDPNDIVERHLATTCLGLAVAQVATLRFEDRVLVDRPGAGSTGTLVLVAHPSGRGPGSLVVETVGGTPLLGSPDASPWRPRLHVDADGPVRRARLPVRPARCDEHVFMEAAGATAFLVRVRLGAGAAGQGPAGEGAGTRGRTGVLTVRMSPAGASRALAFARDSCGL